MANPTWLDLKTFVANQLGKSDQATYNTKRETLINRARQKFYSERQWSWLFKTVTLTMTPGTNSATSLLSIYATDFNYKFDPLSVYSYDGFIKYDFTKVAWSDIGYYTTDRYVYALNPGTKTLKTNQPSFTSITLDYTYIPADHPANNTDDDNSEAAPQINAIAYLAIAYWWLASERSTAKYQLFTDLYNTELAQLVGQEERTVPVKFFRPLRSYVNKGYRSVNNG